MKKIFFISIISLILVTLCFSCSSDDNENDNYNKSLSAEQIKSMLIGDWDVDVKNNVYWEDKLDGIEEDKETWRFSSNGIWSIIHIDHSEDSPFSIIDKNEIKYIVTDGGNMEFEILSLTDNAFTFFSVSKSGSERNETTYKGVKK